MVVQSADVNKRTELCCISGEGIYIGKGIVANIITGSTNDIDTSAIAKLLGRKMLKAQARLMSNIG